MQKRAGIMLKCQLQMMTIKILKRQIMAKLTNLSGFLLKMGLAYKMLLAAKKSNY